MYFELWKLVPTEQLSWQISYHNCNYYIMVQFTNIAINTINTNRCSSKAQWFINITYRHWTDKCFNKPHNVVHNILLGFTSACYVIRTHCFLLLLLYCSDKSIYFWATQADSHQLIYMFRTCNFKHFPMKKRKNSNQIPWFVICHILPLKKSCKMY